MIIGLATAAPAVEEAATPAVPLPPASHLSARISGIPVTMMTARPSRIPNRPVSMMTEKLMVLPSAKPKKGIRVPVALLKNSFRSGSRLPRAEPIRKGRMAPTKWWPWKEASPVAPRMTMVISGPDSTDMSTKAPDSSLVPYWFIRLA
ncbi:hypothetical protein D3C76_1165110 [compost metagenome]